MGDAGVDLGPSLQTINYATDQVQPPSALVVSNNDQLIIEAFGSQNLPSINVFARLLLPDGTIAANQWVAQITSGRTLNTFNFPLDTGFLLSVVVTTQATLLTRGQLYVRVQVWRGSTTQAFRGLQLVTGYVSSATQLAWPGGQQADSYDGYGAPTNINGTQPAAGGEIAEVVPTGALWRFKSFQVQFTASAAVANRTPTFQLARGNGVPDYSVSAPAVVTAGQARTYVLSHAPYAGGTSANFINLALPQDFPMTAGMQLLTVTQNLDVADQYSTPRYLVEEFLVP